MLDLLIVCSSDLNLKKTEFFDFIQLLWQINNRYLFLNLKDISMVY